MVVRVLQLINQDKIALYVALIANLGLSLLNLFLAKYLGQNLVLFLTLLSMLAVIVFECLFAAECARQIIVRKKILIGQAFGDSCKRYFPTLLFGVIIPVLVAAVLLFVAALLLGPRAANFFQIAGTALGLALALGAVFFPVVYVLSNTAVTKIYYLLGNYLRKNFRHALQAILFILLLALLFGSAEALLTNVPYAEVFNALLGGGESVFMVYGLVVMFLGQNQVSELV